MKDVLLDPHQPTFNQRTIKRLFAGQANGCANAERLFALTLFELWRREYHVSAG